LTGLIGRKLDLSRTRQRPHWTTSGAALVGASSFQIGFDRVYQQQQANISTTQIVIRHLLIETALIGVF
jgi:hypothetical protein